MVQAKPITIPTVNFSSSFLPKKLQNHRLLTMLSSPPSAMLIPMNPRYLLPVLSLLILHPLVSSAGDLTQCSSLLQSFSTARLPTWRPSTDCCRWDGVACDPTTGQVVGLNISNRSVNGTVGSTLFGLTSLRVLNLAHNPFDEMPISPDLGNLANLTYLNLSNSGFTGQIPSSVSRLKSLISLDLSTFYLNEVTSSSLKLDNPTFVTLIRNLSNLEELYLDGVNISASGNEWSGVLADSTPRLRVLSLSGCSITGPINDSLSKLHGLSVIRLDQNQLNSSVPDFFVNFSSLAVLRLTNCGLRGVFPKGVFGLKNLTFVDLSSNQMLSGTLSDIPDSSLIENLVVSGTGFSGQLPDSIGKLSSLTRLDLSSCQFSGAVPASIGNLSQLVYLDLSSCQFSGPVPASIGNLFRLVYLDLSMNHFGGAIPSVMPLNVSELSLAHNALNGPIPSSLGGLLNLTKLDLSNNSLSGPIPASLFTLRSLKLLQLNLNQLSGGLKVFPNASRQLGTVDLSNNKLSGQLPKSLFKLSGLKILTLSRNNLSGAIDLDRFIDLRNLSSLDLSYNRFSVQGGDGNTSFSFPAISTLKLASCNLSQIPSFLKSQDEMNNLDLSYNKIGGSIPNWIWKNLSLTYLNLSSNSFTSMEGPLPNSSPLSSSIILDLHSNLLQGPILFPSMNNIILDYSNNNFSSSIPHNISLYLGYTVFFSLANNRVTGEIPPSICNATYLQVLDLSDNMLNGSIPSCLLQAGNDLEVLNLRNNQLHSVIPQNIGEGCVLKTINLNGNKLEGEVPSSLANCTTLEVLDLGNNHIIGSFPFWLDSISSLRVLVLRSNELEGPVVAPTENLANYTYPVLQILDLSSNHFNGTLPSGIIKKLRGMMINSMHNGSTLEFKYMQLNPSYYHDTVTITVKGLDMALVKILTLFTSIDISKNHFIGDIPEDIGNLRSLLALNFSYNDLTGQIPRSIGNLRQLESLDLSANHLSGDIPQGLASLNFLSFVNLSNNNLTGSIPQGSQLDTFSNNSYLGNEGLCGSPLSEQCSKEMPSESKILSLKSVTEADWQFIFIGVGFGGGLAIVFGLLMALDTGKKWYYKRVDCLLWAVLPSSFWRLCDYFGDRRVRDEEGESIEMERWPSRRFCVFCTSLNFDEGRLFINYVDCDCSLGE